MNITEFNAQRATFGIEGTGIDATAKTDLIWTDKVTNQVTYTIKAGERVHLWFSPKQNSSRVFIQHHDQIKTTRLITAHKRLTGINKPPTLRTLEKWDWNGYNKTVTGHKTEPDGYGCDGSPSWSLIIGVI
jgi:hypothetical protein